MYAPYDAVRIKELHQSGISERKRSLKISVWKSNFLDIEATYEDVTLELILKPASNKYFSSYTLHVYHDIVCHFFSYSASVKL